MGHMAYKRNNVISYHITVFHTDKIYLDLQNIYFLSISQIIKISPLPNHQKNPRNLLYLYENYKTYSHKLAALFSFPSNTFLCQLKIISPLCGDPFQSTRITMRFNLKIHKSRWLIVKHSFHILFLLQKYTLLPRDLGPSLTLNVFIKKIQTSALAYFHYHFTKSDFFDH